MVYTVWNISMSKLHACMIWFGVYTCVKLYLQLNSTAVHSIAEGTDNNDNTNEDNDHANNNEDNDHDHSNEDNDHDHSNEDDDHDHSNEDDDHDNDNFVVLPDQNNMVCSFT